MSFRELIIGCLVFIVVRLLVSALRNERNQEQAIVRKYEPGKRDAEARAVEERYRFTRSQVKMMRLLLFCGVIVAVAVGALYFCFWRERPYVLIRFTAARAILATAEFQHRTKLTFEVAQGEGFIPGACINFEFLPEKLPLVREYLKDGTMKFIPYRNSMPIPYNNASLGSVDLSVGEGKFLLGRIDSCDPRRAVTQTTGAYEVKLGEAAIQVTGIRKSGNQALVDFRWHFDSINEIGQTLPRIQSARQQETVDPHLTAEEKSIAPFWTGVAEFAKYDDGWRVVKINLESGRAFERWEYGPHWPDPEFNWNAFDENENRY